MKKITVVSGVMNEEESVEDVYNLIKNTFHKIKTVNYEHLFLDNGSTDNSLAILKRLARKDKKVKILSYSKNFGPITSGMVGLRYATGDGVLFYECNMKDPVDLIPVFVKYWLSGYELVYGIRKKTADNFILGLMRRLFYILVNFTSSKDIPAYYGGYGIIDRKIIDAIKDLDDYKPYLRGLITTVGFRHKSFEYVRLGRKKGKSKSNLHYLIDVTINAVISYSIMPIRLCTYLGLGLSALSIVTAIVYLVLHLLFWKALIPGVAAIVFLVLIFSGVQLFFLGIIGEYIGAIHSQVRKKPFVVIREKINFNRHA